MVVCNIAAIPATSASADDIAYRRFGKMTFVDLAGSERLATTESAGVTRAETGQINKSLFALGKVGAASLLPTHANEL